MNLSRSLIVSFMMFRFRLVLVILSSSLVVVFPVPGRVPGGSLAILVFFHQGLLFVCLSSVCFVVLPVVGFLIGSALFSTL